MRIEEALERFETQLEADGRSVHTRKQYARHVRLFAAWARDLAPRGDRLEGLDHEAVAQFLASPAATGREGGGQKLATSANCLRSSLRMFLGYCHRAGYAPTDAGQLIRRARCSPPPPRAMSEDDERRLLGVLAAGTGPEAERDHALFHLLLRSGLRIGSAIALEREDVFLDRSELQIRRAKGDQRERVFLGKAITAHLKRYLAGRPGGPLLTDRSGRRITQRHAQRRLAEWVARAGITSQVSPHSLRHSFATKLYRKTGDVLIVQAALRHRSIASTVVYARPNEDRLRRAL